MSWDAVGAMGVSPKTLEAEKWDVRFTVPGLPVPQGSAKWVPSHTKPGKVIPKTNKRLENYRAAVQFWASSKVERIISEPVEVELVFTFLRPQSHFGTRKGEHYLKPTAPQVLVSRGVGDIDKLARAVLDALTGVAIVDDSLVAELHVSKRYSVGAEGPHTVVRLRRMPNLETVIGVAVGCKP